MLLNRLVSVRWLRWTRYRGMAEWLVLWCLLQWWWSWWWWWWWWCLLQWWWLRLVPVSDDTLFNTSSNPLSTQTLLVSRIAKSVLYFLSSPFMIWSTFSFKCLVCGSWTRRSIKHLGRLVCFTQSWEGILHISYLSLFLHNHNLRPENFTLRSA